LNKLPPPLPLLGTGFSQNLAGKLYALTLDGKIYAVAGADGAT
jgi:hypothetical protein